MRLANAGDQGAYRELLAALARTFRRSVGARLRQAGRGHDEVEDIVQEVLLAVHLKRHTWDPALPFAPWVHAVARYKMIDALRRHGLRRFVPIDELAEILPDRAGAEPQFADAERMIAQLGEREQAIVRAISLDGRSAAEVATQLAMSEGAVRVALHRALKQLARLYQGQS